MPAYRAKKEQIYLYFKCLRGSDPDLRAGLHKLGFRYRLHYGLLPGKPDMVFPKYRAIIMINGCFWHGHNCHLFKWPSTRQEFWKNKIVSNQIRDERNLAEYQRNGWRTLVIWECALKGKNRMSSDAVIDYAKNWLYSGTRNEELMGSLAT